MENFSFTPEEATLMADASWIYTKNRVITKVMQLFGNLQEVLAAHPATAAFPFPEQCEAQGAKISKGEQYKELPWVILDYPRYFSRDAIFAFRTMFWWGHYFSCTLHLAGTIKEQYHTALIAAYPELAAAGFRVYEQEDPWEHDFENGNYRAIATIDVEDWKKTVSRYDFIKLAKPFALQSLGEIIPDVAAAYAALLGMLGCNTTMAD